MWFCKFSLILVSLNLIKSAPVEEANRPPKIDVKVNIQNAYITVPINHKYLENLVTGILLKTFMEANQVGKPVNSDWNAEIPVSFNLGEENSGLSSEVANFEVSLFEKLKQ